LASLFTALSVDNILLLFECVLLEKHIVLQSAVLHRLTDVAEMITTVRLRDSFSFLF